MRRAILGLLLALPGFVSDAAAQVDAALLNRLAAQFQPANRAFAFAAIGDQQYGNEGERKWPALVESINKAIDAKFVVHVGDIKNGGSVCSDALFQDRFEWFNKFQAPFILTPGDNEWTDCHRPAAGNMDPLERLAKLRKVFFADEQSLGKNKRPLVRESQDARYTLYRENALWTEGGMVFATLHIIGSNNNRGRTAEQDAEYEARNKATNDWMRTAFALAKRNNFAGVVLVFQADPLFPLEAVRGPEKIDVRTVETSSGFTDFLRVLREETIAFGKPVLAVHGDSHFFRFDKPLTHAGGDVVIDNFFRLEVPGETDVHWARVEVDPSVPDSPFKIQHMTVKANMR